MEPNEHHRTVNLEELSHSDFEIADHQPDIMGWEVVDSDGNEIGEVQDLIFDPQEGKVRYIVADIETDQENHTGYVLIPIGIVTLDDDEDEVIIPGQHTAALYTLPAYEKGKTISPVEELAVRYAFLGAGSLPNAKAVVYESHPEDFYNHGHFSDEHFRRRPAPTQTAAQSAPGSKYGLHGSFTAKKGQGQELANLLLEASASVAAAKGCILYMISIDPDNPDLIWVTEAWDSKNDHDNALNVPAARELISKAMPLIAGTPMKGQELMVIGGHGIV